MALWQGYPGIRRHVGLITGNKARNRIIAALTPAGAAAAPAPASLAIALGRAAIVLTGRLAVGIGAIRFAVIFGAIIVRPVFADDQLTIG